MNEDRQAALFGAKLRALVRDRWPDVAGGGRVGSFPGGATLVADNAAVGWVLLGDDAERRLGGALAWGRQTGAESLHLLADNAAAAVLARRAGPFARPPTVWGIDGRALVPVEPAPLPRPIVPSPEAELFRVMLVDAGAEAVVEGGDVVGEVSGLEVARAVTGADGSTHLEVGIGRFDREAFALMNPDLPDAAALAKAVAVVREHRRPGAPRHPLNQLVPERWLRSVTIDDPSIVGATDLAAVPSALPRRNLRETAPASAVGVDTDGRPVLATCSAGVDLELVPTAADDRALHAPGARLVLVVPERDAVPVTRELARSLAEPADVVAVPGEWRR